MNKLMNTAEIKTIPSYEIAEMMGRKHKEVLKMLEGQKAKDGSTKHVGIIQVISESGELHLSDYFIESTYKVPGNNKTYKCYECTKMGCDMLANKMTGEKGILFTAKYVAKFNAMEKAIELPSTEGIRKVVKEELDKKVPKIVGTKAKGVTEYINLVKRLLGIPKVNADYYNIMNCFKITHGVERLEDIPYTEETMIELARLTTTYRKKVNGQKRLF